MKKQFPLLFFFSILFFLQPLSAQIDFAPVGAKWWQEYWVLEPFNNFYTYESTGDTILGGTNARIIELTSHIYMNPPKPIPEATIYLASDEDRVYSWIKDDFYLLYDFSAQVGDTLIVGVNPAIRYYSGGGTPYIEDTSKVNFFRTIVDSVFMTTVNNESFRSYSSVGTTDHPDFIAGGFGVSYIEGSATVNEKIGFYGFGGPLGSGGPVITAGNAGQMRCYHDPLFAYPTTDTTFCDPYVFVEAVEESKAFDFQLFPNPIQNGLLFMEGITSDHHLQIIDFSGKVLLHQQVGASPTRLSLDIGFLENGLYWVKVQTKDGFALTKKIIVLQN